MAWKSGTRRIRTIWDERPKVGGQTVRIRIPQPVERPLGVRGADVVNQALLRPPTPGFTLHRRGMRRPFVGQDERERRAISHDRVRGTLPERILYLWLITKAHMQDGIDFTFQSSLVGGRLELGGIVADFKFELIKLIINVQGPTHTEFLRTRKDEEQQSILEDMGYQVYDITDEEIYNEAIFEDKMRRLFNWTGSGSGSGYSYDHVQDEEVNPDSILVLDIMQGTQALLGVLNG